MKILGTGLDGLVGSRIVELLKDQYEFESSDVDITDRDGIITRIRNSDASIVLHLAAKTSVDGCEEDREEDIGRGNGVRDEWKKKKTAWAVNVYGTQNIVDACQASNKKLIYISTDFVFDGSRPPAGATSDVADGYRETDKPNPVNWYGKTKYEGEKVVQKLSSPWIIARIAYPYRASFAKKDFVRALIHKFQNKENLQMVTDHIMTPTFVDDIACALHFLIKNNSTGIFHVVGSEFISPYEAAIKIAEIFDFSKDYTAETTRSEYFYNRVPRPFQLALKNDKIQNLGVKMRGFEEGLEEVKKQLVNF